MPDLWFDVDTAIAEAPVNILPLLDATDFKTIENAVAYDAAGMALYWHFVTTAGAYTVTAVTPTTGGNYDWADQGDAGIYTIEIPASGGASINNDTEGFGWFTGSATGVLPWRGPVIGFRAAALNNALIDGGDTLDVNVTEISGDGTAADNLEAATDGGTYNVGGGSIVAASVTALGATAKTDVNAEVDTALSDIGLNHLLAAAVAGADVTDNSVVAKLVSKSSTADWDTYANTTDSLEAISDGMASLAPVSATADSATVTTGSTIAGTYANTATDDANNYTLAPVTPAVGGFGLNVTLVFELGTGRVPTSVAINGYWNGNGRFAHVWAYDYANAVWRQLSNTSTYMAHRTSETNYAYTMSREYVEADGTVQIRFTSTSTTVGDRLYLDRVLLYHLTEAVSGSAGATPQQVWEYGTRTLTSSTGEPADTSGIADAVWDEARAGHVAAGTFGEGVQLAEDTITAAKYDEATAYPLKSADTGATAVARTGADSDTLETLSDQLDSVYTGTPPSSADIKTALEADGSKLDHLWEMTEDDGGTRRYTANALELGPTGSALTAQQTRDALKLAPSAGAAATGSVDKHLDDIIATAGVATVSISATQAATIVAGELALRTFYTFSQAVSWTSSAALNTATKVWLAIKLADTDLDSASVIFLEQTAGLTVVAQTAYTTTAHGTLVVSGSVGAWVITAGLDEVATGLLKSYAGRNMFWELKALIGADTHYISGGRARISQGIVQAIV